MLKMKNIMFEDVSFNEFLDKLNELQGLSSSEIYSVIKLNKYIKENKDTYIEAKRKLVDEYGKVEDDKITIPEHNVPEFNKKLNDLLWIEFEVGIKPIKYSDKFNLKPKDFMYIEDLFIIENID